ncbi:hypothetical protein [Schleiferia thermophila]|uniref:Uncharacterized protein n=1 Tax=Schleiferia thermophila TaxID=884107 RepID=A0A369ADA0_9FLAO|nr:hypothetical protein [Schleiferia thermophila]RCX05404.1 hypothetical protein DES35_101689 [Schleiferia thermophila]
MTASTACKAQSIVLILLLQLAWSNAILSQPSGDLNWIEQSLALLGREILSAETYSERNAANQEFDSLLLEALKKPESLDYLFAEVKNLSRIQSQDKKVVVYTWLLPKENPGEYEFYGYVQIRDKNGKILLHQLKDETGQIPQPEYTALKPERWYGALYYQIIDVRHQSATYYTLLGYKPMGKVIQRKVIDVLHLHNPKKPIFGAPIFYVQDFVDRRYMRKPFRLFYDYSASVSATMRYREKEKMIIMDHLAPPDYSKKGIYAVYGPDFSYDGLYWNNGHWHLKEQIRFDTGIKDDIPSVPPPVRRKF